MKANHSFFYSIAITLGVVGALAAPACGGGSSSGGSGGTGGGSSSSSSGTVTTSSSTSSSGITTSSSSSSSSGTPGTCAELTADGMWAKNTADGKAAVYATSPTPDQGDTADTDTLRMEFYGSAGDPKYNGETAGTFDLTMGGDENYATCSRCVVIIQDPTGTGKTFFQSKGTLVVDATSDQINGSVSATMTDVTLVEVDIDSSTFTSTPVPGGACLHIASAKVSFTTVPPPAEWKCDASYYGDGLCDCGCGAQDMDCADLAVASCDYCDDMGSCSTTACPGTIDPTNNAVCTP